MSLVIAPMAAEHIPAIAALEQTCFSQPWSEDALREELDNPLAHFVVALAGDTVVGYMGLHTPLDEGFVTNIATHPAHRRQGVATALLRHQLDFGKAAGLYRLALEVRASNHSAISLYEREGFTLDGTRRGFYTHPTEDARLYSFYYNEKDEQL